MGDLRGGLRGGLRVVCGWFWVFACPVVFFVGWYNIAPCGFWDCLRSCWYCVVLGVWFACCGGFVFGDIVFVS